MARCSTSRPLSSGGTFFPGHASRRRRLPSAFRLVSGETRVQVTFLTLDWLLGEDDVERWVGVIESLEAAPEGDEWTLAEWKSADGSLGLVASRRGLRWIDAPLLDRHHSTAAPYAAQKNGLPADAQVLEGCVSWRTS